ncbi:MAG TPA: DsbC family protein [Casimicrobiaceae bacterium]
MTSATPFRSRVRVTLAAACAAATLSLAGLAGAQSADKAAPLPPEAAAIKKTLEQKFPGAEIRGISKTNYMGLYEVQFDDRIVYTDAKAKYVVIGAIYDTDSKTNLTEERQRKLNRVNVATLPLDLAIKKVKGNGERVMYVFSDADCPFCHKLEEEMKSVDNVTIYTFLYPIDTLHPDAARKSKIIWCAPDRQKAWDDFFATGALPDNKGDCDNPVAKTAELGAKFRVNATPTLVFADGSIVPGALPAQRIEAELKTADAEAKKLAAARK